MRYFILFLLLLPFCSAEETPTCKVTFSVVVKDNLNNTYQGFSPKTLDWFRKEMSRKYPDVCYTASATPLVMFFSSSPATYHGTKVVTSTNEGTTRGTISGDVNATYQGTETTSSSTAVPYEVEYQNLYLSIEMKQADGEWKVVHNFSGKTLHSTMYWICYRNCHPDHKNIENAVKWLHDGGLADPMQSTIQ